MFQVANSSGEDAEAASVVPVLAGVVVFVARFGVVVLVVLVVLVVVLATLWIHGSQTLVHANSMPGNFCRIVKKAQILCDLACWPQKKHSCETYKRLIQQREMVI